MKKTFLSLMAMGFGVSVAFAQTAPAEAGSPVTTEQTTEVVAQDQQDRVKVELSELPEATQAAFNDGEFSNLEVLAIYEVAAEEGAEAKVYEFELAQSSEASGTSEMEGVEVEQVSERQPDVILQIDENGQLIKEEKLDEEGQ